MDVLKVKTFREGPLETLDSNYAWTLRISCKEPISVAAIIGVLLANANHYYKSIMGMRTTEHAETEKSAQSSNEARGTEIPNESL